MTGKAIVFILFLGSAIASADEIPGFRLEGVMLDDQTPEGSIAMINGQALRPGDTIGEYRVHQVIPGAVLLEPVSGGSPQRLEVSAAPLQAAPLELPKPVSRPDTWQEHLKGWWENLFKPSGNSNSEETGGLDLWERAAVTDLTQIYMAGAGYFDSRQTPPGSFADMVQAGLLPDRYKNGTYGKYRYQMKWRGQTPEVQADPLELGRGYRSFYIDSQARIRVAAAGPAGPESALLDR